MIRDGEALPEIYQDPAYLSTSCWELSTSQLSSKYLDGWGYGEGRVPCSDPRDNSCTYRFCWAVVPDGYGLSYSIGDDHIRWTITSLKLGTDIFKDCLAQAAMQTRQMMERASRVEGKKPRL
jgi:carnitine O-acetyltransferase